MKVLGYDPYLKAEQVAEFATPVTSFEAIFTASDFVTVHIPGGASTQGIVNQKLFALMKKTAFFINASRGDVVDEPALIEALRNGTIAGAAIDVYAKEPPPTTTR
jgi:D-3-phosphoglycerate dehydrogenase